MAPNRFHWSTKPEYDAKCDDCSWRSTTSNALGQAAQHHDRLAHTVRIQRTSTTVYETQQRYQKRTGHPPPKATQGKLL